jgi:hypothetical protein
VNRAPDDAAGIAIRHVAPRGISRLEQTVRCRPGKYYRVEADVTCDLTGVGPDAGLFLTLQDAGARVALRSAPVIRSAAPIAIRTYFQAPPDVREVSIGVAVSNARGTVNVQEVRFILIIEPEEESHPMASPPPLLAHPPPRTAESLCVCSRAGAPAALLDRLRRLG